MRQKADAAFQKLLKQARQRKLDICNIHILNKRVAIILPISGLLDSVVVIQRNKTRHLINLVQIKQFARANNQAIIIFYAKHYQLKKNSRILYSMNYYLTSKMRKEIIWVPAYCFIVKGYLLTF